MKQVIASSFIFFILCTGNLYAQLQGQARIDSLLKELPRQKEDTNNIKTLNALSFTYITINPNMGFKYGNEALILATKLGSDNGKAESYRFLGLNLRAKGDYAKALEYASKALEIFQSTKDKFSTALALVDIGNVYYQKSDYTMALKYLLEALQLFISLDNKQACAGVYGNIAGIYRNQGNLAKALEYNFNALKIFEHLGKKLTTAIIIGNIGNVYRDQKNTAKALEYYFKALQLSQEIQNKSGIVINTGSIGNIYREQRKYGEALEYNLKALKIAEEIGQKSLIADHTQNVGNIYRDKHNYTEAISYHYSALKMARDIGDRLIEADVLGNIGKDYLNVATDSVHFQAQSTVEQVTKPYIPDGQIPTGKKQQLKKAAEMFTMGIAIDREIGKLTDLQNAYLGLSTVDSLLGDFKGAYRAHVQYTVLKDSVFSKENMSKITELENSRKEETDSLKNAQERLLADMKYRQQRSYTAIAIASTMALLLFTVFIFRERKKSEGERKKSDDLLMNILPKVVADELKTTGTAAARHFDHVSVLFTDFSNFTQAVEKMNPQNLIDELHTCFKAFDEITTKYNIEKIKTIGDAYLAVCGLPSANPNHAENMVMAAVEINAFMHDRIAKLGERTFGIRIGIHSGSVVAGIVGVKKFAYDIWGDTVNTAARMEQNSTQGKINISETTYELVKHKFNCEYRGEVNAKGKGALKMYYVG